MKYLFSSLVVLFTLILISSCAATRVIVKDCKDAGDDIYNCELIKKI